MEKNLSTPVAADRPSPAVRDAVRASRGRWSRWSRIAVAACLAASFATTLAGCGLVRVAYRNADTVGLLYIDGYLDLTSEQKDVLKPKLRQLVAWHRKAELPGYAAYAADLKRRTGVDITAAEVLDIQKTMRARVEPLVAHAAPDAADLALRLTPDNLKALQEKFAANDDKFRDEMMKGNLERQQKARYEKTLDRAEEWYGRFSRDQRAAIRKLSDARPIDNDLLLAERQRREKDFVDLLAKVQRERPSRDQVIALIKDYDQRFDDSPDPQRRAFQESLRRATAEMDAGIHNLSTPEQRAKAAVKLQDWIDTFDELSRGG